MQRYTQQLMSLFSGADDEKLGTSGVEPAVPGSSVASFLGFRAN